MELIWKRQRQLVLPRLPKGDRMLRIQKLDRRSIHRCTGELVVTGGELSCIRSLLGIVVIKVMC